VFLLCDRRKNHCVGSSQQDGDAVIAITFEMDANSILTVRAKDSTSSGGGVMVVEDTGRVGPQQMALKLQAELFADASDKLARQEKHF
jgi:hypothetical protein